MRSAYLSCFRYYKVSKIFSESKLYQNFIHLFCNFIITQIADTALVGVVHLLCRGIFATLNSHTNLLVRLAERNTGECQAIDILNGKEVVVALVVEDILLDGDMLKHKVAHIKALT